MELVFCRSAVLDSLDPDRKEYSEHSGPGLVTVRKVKDWS